MKVNSKDAVIRQELLSKILNNKTNDNIVSYSENKSISNANNLSNQANDNVNIGLSQYINNNISEETLSLERQEKIARLKELFDKGEYKGPEARELAKSFVEGINDEITIARNTILFDDEE